LQPNRLQSFFNFYRHSDSFSDCQKNACMPSQSNFSVKEVVKQ